MGKNQEEKLRKLNKIYANSVTGKKVAKASEKKPTEITVRNEEIEDDIEVEEDEKNSDERKLEIMALFGGENAGSASGDSNRRAERKMSLPIIPQARSASQRSLAPANTGIERRTSLPMIYESKNIVSRDNKIDASSEKTSLNGNVQKPLQTPPQRSNISETSANNQGGRKESQAEKDLKMIEEFQKNSEENEATLGAGGNNKKAGRFRRLANAARNANMFSNFLTQDLNLRYLQAVYYDPDYNDKYKRLNTPDIETDEEKEADILQDMCDDSSTSGGHSDTEGGHGSSSSPTESDQNESDTSRDSPTKIPEEIKEIIENAQAEEGDDLVKLGIWQEDVVENEADGIIDGERAGDADDEESGEDADEGDDWSIKTMEEDEADSDSEGEEAKEKARKKEEAKGTQEQLKLPPLPQKVALPVGDTPDILISSSEESVKTIYASHFDEYESDIFGSKFYQRMFYLPPSQKSAAGDSDMFYCVPSASVSYYSTNDYFARPNVGTRKRAGKKVKRKKQRKVLNELHLKAAIKKYTVQDMTIAKFGNATRTFRLRLARLGKDPKEIDDKMNAKIERSIRRRLRRRPIKSEELTKSNVKKLPNLSKKAKIMRWVKLFDKNGLIKTYYENGWVENSGESLNLQTDNTVARTHSPLLEARTGEETIENETTYDNADQNKTAKDLETSKQSDVAVVDEKGENQEKSDSNRKRTNKRRRRMKMLENMNKRKQVKSEISSEESFVISKEWQISLERSKTIDDDDGDDEMPKSDHSDRKIGQESNSDDDVSVYTSSTQSEANMNTRVETPSTEPEVKEKEPSIQHEKPPKKHSKGSRWGMVPNLIMAKRYNTLNTELADVTRLLFAQLSLHKTKEYTKLPPIKRKSGVLSKATSRSTQTNRRTGTSQSRNTRSLTLETP